MDELYTESFFQHKKTTAPKTTEETAPIPSPKLQHQLHSSLWLLQQEIEKRFPHSFPAQKLFKQIETAFAISDHAQALMALEKLEEWIDVQK